MGVLSLRMTPQRDSTTQDLGTGREAFYGDF